MADNGETLTFKKWTREQLVPDDFPWDVFWDHSYFEAWKIHGDGEPILFQFRKKNSIWIHAFLERPIQRTDRIDIKTPYGYGGPLSNSTDRNFLIEAEKAFECYANKKGIVAEFIRFHPLLENWNFLFDREMLIEKNRQTVFIDLEKAEEVILSDMTSAFRRGLKKAESSGLVFRELSSGGNLDDFQGLYYLTMQKANADDYYFFSDKHFSALAFASLGTKLFGVYSGENLVSAAMVFCSDTPEPKRNFVHYHLGASDPRFLETRPNNFLFANIIFWAKRQGNFCKIHLGGGTSPEPDNSLFRFKASIGKSRAVFMTGKRIWDHDYYQKLCRPILDKNPELREQENSRFPLYRFPQK